MVYRLSPRYCRKKKALTHGIPQNMEKATLARNIEVVVMGCVMDVFLSMVCSYSGSDAAT
jgi:hypothetical protein